MGPEGLPMPGEGGGPERRSPGALTAGTQRDQSTGVLTKAVLPEVWARGLGTILSATPQGEGPRRTWSLPTPSSLLGPLRVLPLTPRLPVIPRASEQGWSPPPSPRR